MQLPREGPRTICKPCVLRRRISNLPQCHRGDGCYSPHAPCFVAHRLFPATAPHVSPEDAHSCSKEHPSSVTRACRPWEASLPQAHVSPSCLQSSTPSCLAKPVPWGPGLGIPRENQPGSGEAGRPERLQGTHRGQPVLRPFAPSSCSSFLLGAGPEPQKPSWWLLPQIHTST